MANIDWKGIETQTATLAETLLRGFASQAVSGVKEFKFEAEQNIIRWLDELRKGQITKKNFASLVRGERDLAEMRALQKVGIDQVALDTFVSGFIEIVLNAALAAI